MTKTGTIYAGKVVSVHALIGKGAHYIVSSQFYADTRFDEIRVYDEAGEMSPVPWHAFIRDGAVVKRAPARYFEIDYEAGGDK